MTLRSLNITVGFLQLFLNLLVIIPLNVKMISSMGGPFGYGFLVIPVTVPITFASITGFLGVINFKEKREPVLIKSKSSMIVVILFCVAGFFIAGVYRIITTDLSVYFSIGLVLVIVLIARMEMNTKNREKLLLSTNIFLLFTLLLLVVAFSDGDKSTMELIEFIWS